MPTIPSVYRQNTYNYKERGGNSHGNVNFRQKNGHHVRFSAFLQTFDTFQIFKGFCLPIQMLFSARRTFTFYTVSQVNASLQQHAKRRFRIAKNYCLLFRGRKVLVGLLFLLRRRLLRLALFYFFRLFGGCRLFLFGLLGGKSHHIAHGKGKGNALTCRF